VRGQPVFHGGRWRQPRRTADHLGLQIAEANAPSTLPVEPTGSEMALGGLAGSGAEQVRADVPSPRSRPGCAHSQPLDRSSQLAAQPLLWLSNRVETLPEVDLPPPQLRLRDHPSGRARNRSTRRYSASNCFA
jgi:hypothetical protein